MKQLLHQHTVSFKHAFEGLWWSFTTQPNFRIHFLLSAVVVFMAALLHVTRIEFIILVFTIILGVTGELLNTAVEAITDLVTTEWRKEAKIAKDVSAGLMLFIAFGSVIVALVIFLPYLSQFISL